MAKHKIESPERVRLTLDLEVSRDAIEFIVAAVNNAESCDLPEDVATGVFEIANQLTAIINGRKP